MSAEFTVEISRDNTFGPFAYTLWISPAPRFGDRCHFAWTARGAERKAQRLLARARQMGSKRDGDKWVVR